MVLTRAREAIGMPANLPIYRSPRWALPMTLAATVVLALSITLIVERTRHGAPLAATSASPAGSAGIDAPSADAVRENVEDKALAANAVPAAPAALAPAPELSKKSAADAVTESRPARTAILANNSARMLRMQTTEVHAAPHTKAEPAAAPAESKANADAESLWAATSSDKRAEVEAAPVAAGVLAEVTTTSAAPSPRLKGKHATREAWLHEIESLRNAGQVAEADRELAAFHKAFPADAAQTLPAAPPPPTGPAR